MQISYSLEPIFLFEHVKVQWPNESPVDRYSVRPNVQYRGADRFLRSFLRHVYPHAIERIFSGLDGEQRYSLSGVGYFLLFFSFNFFDGWIDGMDRWDGMNPNAFT